MNPKTKRFGFVFVLVFLIPYALAENYYVDDDCDGSGVGTINDPFCTIQEAVNDAVAGDTVLIKAGTYTCSAVDGHICNAYNPAVLVSVSGTEDAWITIKNYEDDQVIISGKNPSGDNYHTDALKITGDYIKIVGLHATGGALRGIGVVGTDIYSDFPSHVVVTNSTAYGNGNGQAGVGFGTSRYAEYVTFDHLRAYDNNIGIQFGYSGDKATLGAMPDDQTEGARHSTIQYCLAYDNRQGQIGNADGIGAGFAYNCTIRNNVVHDNGDDGIDIYASNNVLVENNVAYNHIYGGDGNGIKSGTGGGGNHIFRGNIVFNNKLRGFDEAGGSVYTPGFADDLYHNIVFNNYAGWWFGRTLTGLHFLRNNIAIDNSYVDIHRVYTTYFDSDYNRLGQDSIDDMLSIGQDTNSLPDDPSFIDLDPARIIENIDLDIHSPNFGKIPELELQPESPMIDMGERIPGYHCPNPGEDGGENCKEWYGSAPDIGAYEFQSAVECGQDSDCDDANPCTGDKCEAGFCAYVNYNLDGSDTIGLGDIIAVIGRWGLNEGGPGWDASVDLDGNGNIGLSDIIVLIGVWGTFC